MSDEPQPLNDLGETDCYSYPNGVYVYWGREEAEHKHDRTVRIHADAESNPVIIPADLYGVIRAVLLSSGVGEDHASLLCEAAEKFA